jgi:hypothetical protein
MSRRSIPLSCDEIGSYHDMGKQLELYEIGRSEEVTKEHKRFSSG